MLIDFSTLLFLLSMVTFLIWLVDAYFWQEKRDAENRAASVAISATEEQGKEVTDEQKQRMLIGEPAVVEYAKAFFPILVIVLLLRSFITEPFRIPSPSMVPTLLPGDFILVNKNAYGYRLPVVNHRVGSLGKPARGDVVVFRFPLEPSTNYIKRLIGVPGDVIEYKNNEVTINGKKLKYRDAGNYNDLGAGYSANKYTLRREVIGKVKHNMLVNNQSVERSAPEHQQTVAIMNERDRHRSYTCVSQKKFTVKKGEYFVMGDNRDNSLDSRYWCGVPEKNLVGKAYAIWMNWDPILGLRWERIFNGIE